MGRSRPRIILSAAMSIDGKIATNSGESKLSSKRDIERVHRIRSRVDAILVGRKTVDADDPLLTVRHAKGENPTRIILSSSGSIPTRSKIFKTAGETPTIIATTENASKGGMQEAGEGPVRIISAGRDSVDLKRLMSVLYKQNIRSILLEGGGRTNWEFIRQNLVDEMIITVAPLVVGGRNSTSLVGGAGFPRISASPRFALRGVNRFGDELVLHYEKL